MTFCEQNQMWPNRVSQIKPNRVMCEMVDSKKKKVYLDWFGWNTISIQIRMIQIDPNEYSQINPNTMWFCLYHSTLKSCRFKSLFQCLFGCIWICLPNVPIYASPQMSPNRDSIWIQMHIISNYLDVFGFAFQMYPYTTHICINPNESK